MRSRQGGSSATAKISAPEVKSEASKKSSSMFEEYMKSRQGGSSSAAPAVPAQTAAPSASKGSMFEEYMKSRQGGSATAASSAPSAKTTVAAPAAVEKKVEGVTRDPAPKVDVSDPRKSITAAPSFAEYIKAKRAMGK